MDIDYLLLLQNFREATGNVLSPFMGEVSKFAVSNLPFMFMFLIYWALDRQAGKRIIFGMALGNLMNGFLKLVFCVYRPWIRDARVLPYGDAKVAATGYSFPSGHSTFATGIFGGIGVWQYKQRHRVIAALCWIFMALVMFSRNYLGVHTPQDVLVGFASTAIMIWVAYRIEAWTDEDNSRDLIVMIVGIAVCVAAGIFYFVKPYPLDYAADGSLLVDPAVMRIDSFQGIGFVSAYVIARYFERRFKFDTELDFRTRLVIGLIALVPMYLWIDVVQTPLAAAIGSVPAMTLRFGVMTLYAMVLVPWIMSLVARKKGVAAA